jgi:hypothetical protein
VTPQVTADAAGGMRRELASVLRPRGVGRLVARTATYNVAATAAASLGGIIVARALGPEMRGEYAAVMAWLGVAFIVGGMGQPAALCFYVARDPGNARSYVATSRAMMLVTGTIALAGGMLLAPLLARGNPGLTVAYRIAFATSIVAFIGASYTFSLQAKNLRWWNTVRVSQPVLSLAFLIVLWRLRLLTLTAALIVLACLRSRLWLRLPSTPISTSSSFPRPYPLRSWAGTRSRSRAACSQSRWCLRSETSPFRGWRPESAWTSRRPGCSGWASWVVPASRRLRWCRLILSHLGLSRASSDPGTQAWCRCCGS